MEFLILFFDDQSTSNSIQLTMKALLLISFFCFGLSVPIFSQYKTKSSNFTLHGKIVGKDSGKIILSFRRYSDLVKDTVEIKNGEFAFKGNITEPTLAILIDGDKPNRTNIYIEPGEMRIELVNGKFSELKMTGSKTQVESEGLDKQMAPIFERMEILKNQLISLRDSLGNIKYEEKRKGLEKNYETADHHLEQLAGQINTIQLSFIQTHPQSYLSADLLMMPDKNETLSLDSLKTFFNELDVAVQNSLSGKEIKEDIRKRENNKIGAFAPDFTFIDKNNQKHSLSDFKGKCVVLDLWASYCGPCRKSFTHLKDVYQKYHSKGFEIIAISLDWDKHNWEEAIKQDQIEDWCHSIIGTSQIADADIYKRYFFQGIPRQFVIDKSGKIVLQCVGYNVENERYFDEKMKEIFGI